MSELEGRKDAAKEATTPEDRVERDLGWLASVHGSVVEKLQEERGRVERVRERRRRYLGPDDEERATWHPDLAGLLAEEVAEWRWRSWEREDGHHLPLDRIVARGEALRLVEKVGAEDGTQRWRVEHREAEARIGDDTPLALIAAGRDAEGNEVRRIEEHGQHLRGWTGPDEVALVPVEKAGPLEPGMVLAAATPGYWSPVPGLEAAIQVVGPPGPEAGGPPGWAHTPPGRAEAASGVEMLLWGSGRAFGPSAPWGVAGEIEWASALAAAEPALDRAQEEAARAVAEGRVAMVWGPPGTGKTHVLAWALAGIRAARPAAKIVVAAPTWTAVAGLARRIERCLEQAGVPAGGTRKVWLRGRENAEPPLGWECGGSTADCAAMAEAALSSAEGGALVAGTPRSVERLAAHGGAEWVVLDEAAQAKAVDLLRIASVGSTRTRWTLAGDPLQLGPIREREEADGERPAYLESAWTLAAHGHGEGSIKLLERTWRCGAGLAAAIRAAGYVHGGRALESAVPERRLELDGLPEGWLREVLAPERPVVALLHGAGQDTGECEAAWIAAMVAALERAGARCAGEPAQAVEDAVGVVGMHRAHNLAIRRRIGEACPRLARGALERMVQTTERYQGGERTVVIVACGVGDAQGAREEEGFLNQLRRWNVAVSRARCKAVQLLARPVREHLPATAKGMAEQRYLRTLTGPQVLPGESRVALPGRGGGEVQAVVRWRQEDPTAEHERRTER